MTEKNWFFMRDYSPEEENTENVVDKKLDELVSRMEKLETKLDKLIESNKSMIAYFSARDTRDLNYNIRGYKKGAIPPIGFVPERREAL